MTDTAARPGDFDEERGRRARSPARMPARGWRDIAIRTKRELKRDQVASVAAGVAFFGMLAIFPAMIAAVSLYGLLANPADVERQVASMSSMLPGPAQAVIGERLNALVSQPAGQLSLGLLLSIAVALWTASTGTKAMIDAVNLAYNERETRGFFKLRAMALAMALGLIVAGILAVLMVTLLPAAFSWFGFGEQGRFIVSIARWPALALGALIGLAVLYHFAPNRTRPRWRWVSVGAVVATLLWIGASLLLSLYVSNFGNYDATYGALAGVVVLMLWMYVSSLVILVGAEINSEIEGQTAEDSTVGPEKPIGRRGAVKADRLGESFG
jgi:membrane protein